MNFPNEPGNLPGIKEDTLHSENSVEYIERIHPNSE